MNQRTTQGFSIVEVAVVIFIVVIIGFLGYTFYMRTQAAPTTDSSQSETAVGTAPDINDTADLDTAAAVVDETNTDAALDDLNKLDDEAATF